MIIKNITISQGETTSINFACISSFFICIYIFYIYFMPSLHNLVYTAFVVLHFTFSFDSINKAFPMSSHFLQNPHPCQQPHSFHECTIIYLTIPMLLEVFDILQNAMMKTLYTNICLHLVSFLASVSEITGQKT